MSQLQLKDASLNFELKVQEEPALFIQGCVVTGSAWPQVDELSANLQCLNFGNLRIGLEIEGASHRTGLQDPLTLKPTAAKAYRAGGEKENCGGTHA